LFDFLKLHRLPEGPYEFVGAVEIDRSAAEVFPLLDLTDARRAKRQLGERVDEVEGTPGAYRMVIGEVPDLLFELTLTDHVAGAWIGFNCTITPRVGRLAVSHELYTLEELGPDACLLKLVNTVTFADKLRPAALQDETAMMTVAVHNALAKLKLHAEGGVEAVRAVERDLVGGPAVPDFPRALSKPARRP
jgi:hypothetical protein